MLNKIHVSGPDDNNLIRVILIGILPEFIIIIIYFLLILMAILFVYTIIHFQLVQLFHVVIFVEINLILFYRTSFLKLLYNFCFYVILLQQVHLAFFKSFLSKFSIFVFNAYVNHYRYLIILML